MSEYTFVRARNLGFSVIPIINKTARPVSSILEWKTFVHNLPEEELCDVWDFKYPIGDEFGIAVIAGPASMLSWSDLDTLNPLSHQLSPKSPYSKAGIPGRDTRFFGWNSLYQNYSNISEARDGKQCAILFQSHYTIIPPSKRRPDENGVIHNYRWTGKSLWDLEDRSELPIMPDPKWHLDLPVINETSFVETNSGRNNKLKSMVFAGYSKGKSDIEIAREIMEYDSIAHTKPLFTDSSEGFSSVSDHDTFLNARRFVLSNFQTATRQKIEVDLSPSPDIILDDNIYVFKPKALPAPYPGVLSHFCDVARTSLPRVNTTALLGTALSLMSHLARHRIWSNRLHPNIINMIISPSGNGKSTSSDYLHDVLGNDLKHIVKSNYKSGAAFVEVCKQKPDVFHFMDEVKIFIGAMKSNESFSSDLVEMVNGIYSSTNRIFQMPITAARAKDLEDHMIKYPYLNMCGLTHAAGFRAGMSKYLAESGFLARCIIFWDYTDCADIDDYNSTGVSDIRSSINKYEELLNGLYPIKRASRYVNMVEEFYEYQPTEILFNKQAKDLLTGYTKDKMKLAKEEEVESLKSILLRHPELVIKVSQLAFLSDLSGEMITRDHVEWSISLIETLFYNFKPELAIIETPDDFFGKKATQAIHYLRSRGPTGKARLQQIMHVDETTFTRITKYLKTTGLATELEHGRGSKLVAIKQQ